jgi:zinc ribbon protein
MYCDGCGTQLTAGAQFCTKCGKAIVGGGAGAPAGQGMGQSAASTGAYRAAGSDGRVQRNLRTLATLWTINGILRLAEVCGMMIFGTMLFPFMRGWGRGMVWGRWGMDIPFLGGLFSVGALLGIFGVLHLLLAWGLFERAPWARMLGLVIGFLALLRFPLGTALGIYTLWVLLPEESAREYDRLVQGDGRWNSAAVSS